jgi:AcrR family transcriptional regulator
MRRSVVRDGGGRSEAARQAVLEAADDLLVERGFAGLTIEAIAERAGVAKQTIYRWWPSKVEILMDAFMEDAESYLTPPDSGNTLKDLRVHLERLGQFLTAADAGAVFQTLIAQGIHDREMRARFREHYVARQRALDRVIFERAKERGEISPSFDIDLAVDQVVGPIYYRVLVTGQPVTEHFIKSLLRQVELRSKRET